MQNHLSEKNKNKAIVLINSNQEGKKISVEELIAQKINTWQGWHCFAGFNNIYITHDGNIYGAVCREGGHLGNVFETFVDFSPQYTLCKKKWCMCGSDMSLRKFRSTEDEFRAYAGPIAYIDSVPETARAVQPNNQSPGQNKFVSWDIGRRCNYSCSYCPPSASNNYESHRSWGSLKQAIQNIFRTFVRGDQCKFNFGGGEPTLNPSLIDLLKWIKDANQRLSQDYHHQCS